MGVPVSFLYLPLFFLFPCFFCKFSPQQNTDHAFSTTSETICVGSKKINEHAHVFIYYPIEKPGNAFTIFLNKKTITNMGPGSMLEYRLLREGPVIITVTESNKNTAPYTPSKNSRTINVKKGRSYYLRVNGSGTLDVMNAEKAEKNFPEQKEFIHPPGLFIETNGTNLAFVSKSPPKNSPGMRKWLSIKTLLLNFSKLLWY